MTTRVFKLTLHVPSFPLPQINYHSMDSSAFTILAQESKE